MKLINSKRLEKLEKFFMSIGWAGEYEDPESIHGGIVRARKGTYLPLPMMKLEFRTKEEFIARVTEVAGKIWDKMEETKEIMK